MDREIVHGMSAKSSFLKMIRSFVEVGKIRSNERSTVRVFRSENSGLRVFFFEKQSPLVNAYFTVCTKPVTDHGLPHTLEHLVFMGSKKYPYKGFLDAIANLCLASGTNGYTDEDHTAYSISTAGCEGFYKAFPVYMDHLLHPLLTESQFKTEIHHINGNGFDGGVVYSEMQDHENDMENRIDICKRAMCFPKGSPYRAVSGGSLPALREVTLDQIIDFHKRHYQLPNMAVSVIGDVDVEKVLDILADIEVSEGYKTKIKHIPRPFDDVVYPERYRRGSKVLHCPVEDVEHGIVSISWVGPEYGSLDGLAFSVLMTYFCDGPESILQQRYVQSKKPVCSNVELELRERGRYDFGLRFSGVRQRYFNDRAIFSHTPAEIMLSDIIDLSRLRAIIKRHILQILVHLEGNPTNYYHGAVATYLNYARGVSCVKDDTDFLTRMFNEIDELKKLQDKDEEYWENLAKQYLTKDAVVVVGVPDFKLAVKLAEDEKLRVEEQCAKLGPEGLARCGNELKAAAAANEEQRPTSELLRQFMVEDMTNFKYINVDRFVHEFGAPIPYSTSLHITDSKFLIATINIDVSGINPELLPYMKLLITYFFESNAVVDGGFMSYENIGRKLKEDFISHNVTLGFGKGFREFLKFEFTVLPENFGKVPKWFDVFMSKLTFENDRIAVAANKEIGNAAEIKHDSDTVAASLINFMTSPAKSVSQFYCSLVTEDLHKSVVDEVAKPLSTTTIAKLESLVAAIEKCPTNIHLIGDDEGVATAMEIGWQNTERVPTKRGILVGDASKCFDFKTNEGKTICIRTSSSESTFVIQKVPYKFEYLSEKIVYAKLLAQYLSQMEGPLWEKVRGKGYAYGVGVDVSGNTSLCFYLYRASDLVNGYAVSKAAVLDCLRSRDVTPYLFDAAKRSLIFEILQDVGNTKSCGKFSVINLIRGLGPNDNLTKKYINTIEKATPENMLSVSDAFFKLFDDEAVVRSVVASKSTIEDVKKVFPNTEVRSYDYLYY